MPLARQLDYLPLFPICARPTEIAGQTIKRNWCISIDSADAVIAIDGKTLRAAIGENERQLHALGATEAALWGALSELLD